MNAPAPDVVHFKVGELVSIKVPRSDCHKTDCKRILGIVVNQHGEKDHQCDIPVTFKVFVQQLIESVMEGIMDYNDAVAWVSRSTTANISDDATMMQQPRHLVKSAIEKELFTTLKGTDSAQVQFMSLAGLLRKKITVRTYNEDTYPQEIFGIGEDIILLRVPIQLPSVDGNIRLSHLVPAIPFTPKEKDVMDMCICESLGVCNDDDSMGWVACIVCCRWVHCACIDRHSFKHYQEKEFTCGCDKIHPFQLKQLQPYESS